MCLEDTLFEIYVCKTKVKQSGYFPRVFYDLAYSFSMLVVSFRYKHYKYIVSQLMKLQIKLSVVFN